MFVDYYIILNKFILKPQDKILCRIFLKINSVKNYCDTII